MPDDIAFKIQLGLILPKLKEKVSPNLTEIVEELVQIVGDGTIEDEAESGTDLSEVKDVMLKVLEILLGKEILPSIEAKQKPEGEAKADESAPEESEESAEAGG